MSVLRGIRPHASHLETARVTQGGPTSFPQIGLAAAVGWSGALRIVPMFPPAQAAAAFDPRQPFSRAEARAAGLTAEMLLSSRFHKICWDTYVARDVPITPLLRAKAVIRLVPSGSHVSHHTAAELWGADPPIRPCHARHIALGLWAVGSPRSPLSLPKASSADHASQGPAYLDSRADFPGPCRSRRRVGRPGRRG